MVEGLETFTVHDLLNELASRHVAMAFVGLRPGATQTDAEIVHPFMTHPNCNLIGAIGVMHSVAIAAAMPTVLPDGDD